MRKSLFIHEYLSGGGHDPNTHPASWLREGRAMRDALVREFAALPRLDVHYTRGIHDRTQLERGTSVPARAEHEKEIVQTYAAKCDWTLILAPETAGLLRERCAWVEEVGGRSLGSTPSAVDLAGDKLSTYHCIQMHTRIDFPPTIPISYPIPPPPFPPPWVCKPVDGAGCFNTFRVQHTQALAKLPHTPALLQPLVEGTPMSASFLVARGGVVQPVGVAAQSVALHPTHNEFSYGGGCAPSGCVTWAEHLVPAVSAIRGLAGWIGVDFIHTKDDRIVFLELNPRVTTSFVAFQRLLPAGTLARAWLDVAQGQTPCNPLALAMQVHDQAPVAFDCEGHVTANPSPTPTSTL